MSTTSRLGKTSVKTGLCIHIQQELPIHGSTSKTQFSIQSCLKDLFKRPNKVRRHD